MAEWSMALRSGRSLLWRRGSSKIINQKRENLGSIRQDGRVVYGAAFRSQSPLEARVRIPLLSGNTERNIGENFEHS
ncbi:unnamed protein product [Clavelina lepadiformis]|uniref:Uncharacterized protein n=1 Tax=Clavelina lepadiformis TaxID=159417 RepID=A0ABP0G1K5_CLALP